MAECFWTDLTNAEQVCNATPDPEYVLNFLAVYSSIGGAHGYIRLNPGDGSEWGWGDFCDSTVANSVLDASSVKLVAYQNRVPEEGCGEGFDGEAEWLVAPEFPLAFELVEFNGGPCWQYAMLADEQAPAPSQFIAKIMLNDDPGQIVFGVLRRGAANP